MVGEECEKPVKLEKELSCQSRLDDPAASDVSDENIIKNINEAEKFKIRISKTEYNENYGFKLPECFEVIYKDEKKEGSDDEPPR